MPLKSRYSKVFLTGATGWLGMRILMRLIEEGCLVTCLVRPGEVTKIIQKTGANIIIGDVMNPHDVEFFLAQSENALVIHIAGIIHPPGKTHWFNDINYGGTKNILETASRMRCKRLLVMSSNSPIGVNPNPDHLFDENSPYNPYMGYGKSKKKMELMLREAMTQMHRPEITIIRAPWFYGPGQPPRQTEFFRMIKNGKFPIMGKGLNKRSMAYVDSLAYGILLAAESPAAVNEIFWIADERPYSMVEIVDTVKDVLTKDFNVPCKKKNLHVPTIIADVAEMADACLQKLGLYQQKIHVLSEMNKTIACDISKAKRLLGYKPLVDLRQGMHNSIEWCFKNIDGFQS